MEKHLAIIGASYLQLPLIEKAKEMGYITHVFAWAANDVGEKAADHFYPISIIEKEQILDKCKEIGICGICSIASDVAMVTVNYVANALNLSGNSPEATYKSTNKHAMRLAFEKRGDPSPKSYLVDSQTDLSTLVMDYPIIVKPTDRSGSRGIYKLYNSNGLKEAVSKAIDESFEKKALIEEFAEGQEYSVEFISYKGIHHFLQLTHKYTTGEPHFIETGHLEPAPVEADTVERVKQIVSHALDTLEIKNGASHSELKIDSNGNIKLIEIGGRMGGDCIGSDLVRYSTGYDFVRMVIDVACGSEPVFEKVCEPCAVKSLFMFTQEDVDEYERMKREEPEKIIKLVSYFPENLGHVTDSSNRVGCYIVKA
ncbi:ATP-grasp domain-containing protein [Ruminococcus sp.]|uniref:ATP-grasp domain-containing protein n=1 Tax=Ruminococcus sp. TaxID=41978 RepID=UPI0025E71584|nr:ATP-grasp domain-containing protein [Ruminococcus sp.]